MKCDYFPSFFFLNVPEYFPLPHRYCFVLLLFFFIFDYLNSNASYDKLEVW